MREHRSTLFTGCEALRGEGTLMRETMEPHSGKHQRCVPTGREHVPNAPLEQARPGTFGAARAPEMCLLVCVSMGVLARPYACVCVCASPCVCRCGCCVCVCGCLCARPCVCDYCHFPFHFTQSLSCLRALGSFRPSLRGWGEWRIRGGGGGGEMEVKERGRGGRRGGRGRR